MSKAAGYTNDTHRLISLSADMQVDLEQEQEDIEDEE